MLFSALQIGAGRTSQSASIAETMKQQKMLMEGNAKLRQDNKMRLEQSERAVAKNQQENAKLLEVDRNTGNWK